MSLHWPPEMGGLWRGATSLIWGGAQPKNIQRLWAPAPLEVDNHEHPGVHGLLPRDALLGQQELDLDYLLSALVLPNGSPAPNPAAGVNANYRELITRVGDPRTWGDSTTMLTAVDALGDSWQGAVQMSVGPLGVERGSAVPVTLTIVIPAGELVLVSS